MKCDELKPLVFSISDLVYVDEPTPQPNFQNPHDHAVYKATEVDAAIAELKAKVDELSFDKKLLESHWESEKIRCESASRNCIELSNENAKLVSKIESLKVGHRQGIANLKSYYKQKLEDVNELIKTARQMLEDAKASHYAESVDAGMRERRLKRALYKACANWACAKMEYEQFDSNIFMCGFITDKEVSWESMMNKCLKKAEECK